MLKGLFSRVVGDSNEREIRKLLPLVEAINAREGEMERYTPAELRALTDQFRRRLSLGDTLDDLLPEAFAAVREVAKRTVSMRPFDVQLIGGIVLHQGKVAEMKTGEGKTLVATLPVYLNALTGQGVHLVTVNDYLARRDTLWMGPIYHLLGLSVGLLQSGMDQPAYLYDPGYQREPYPGLRPVPRRLAYAADVTYGTNNEFGFDYLRDNLAYSLEVRVQRPLQYAIVDEVDNIFIDEARTPLIISGPSGEPVEQYERFAAFARQLQAGVHYELDEKERTVFLTDEGLALVERETGIENIYDEANYRYVHYMQQALKAQVLFQEGRDYIRQRKRIILVDQHTGRLMPDRRLSEGLHQAIEAKEGVPIQPRDVTSATITIQNYFRMYRKLAGMSGTAVTESEEFYKIYKLDVLAIPTNRPMIREDHPDVVYRTEEAKLRAVAREILTCHSRGQPVLVGTTSVEMSERLSTRLAADRLQMAALAPRIADALQAENLNREDRSRLREVMNSNLETTAASTWRRLMRDLGLEANPLAPENIEWVADYLRLPESDGAREVLERALRDGIPHQVLNAKEHTREAAIIARAGEPGTVTIATNMAGRGVDIRLGGELTDEVIARAHQALRARGLDPFRATSAQMDSAVAEVAPQYARRRDQVLAAGGLHILGTERHEARRIDNQLRGRSGRQGEPGSSRFYLSLEDDLMRRFGRTEMLGKLMQQIGDEFPIEHSLVSKTIERAQTSVEGYNFDIRKHLLEYDDVLNRQRESIYGERLRILLADDVRDDTWRMLEAQTDEYLERVQDNPEQQRLLFAGLDEVVPLILPAPTAPFTGVARFGSHLTAFPPFSLGFLSDQLAGQPVDQIEKALERLPQQAAAAYTAQASRNIRETCQATLDRYEERLEWFRSLLDEKIDEFEQLAEERGEPADPRRLSQHLERTYPLKLSTPRQLLMADVGTLKTQWKAQIDVEYHRQTCLGLLDRVRARLPQDVAQALSRLRPSRLAAEALGAEMDRVREMASLRASKEPERRPRETPEDILEFVATVKQAGRLDPGRLDRLVGHALGLELDDLIVRYTAALDADKSRRSTEAETGRLRSELERLREGMVEGRRGSRSDLITLLGQLNDLVHLEIADLERLLTVAVSHECDKWAYRQIEEIAAEAGRTPLQGSDWTSIAEHLLNTYYAERQAFDREHRRRLAWLPRLPLHLLAGAWAEGMDRASLREAVLSSLRSALEIREQIWGQQELNRWRHVVLDELDDKTFDSLIRYLGIQELGEYRNEQIGDLPEDLYEALRFVLALRQVRTLPLGRLPQAEALLAQLGEQSEAHWLDTPVGQLEQGLQEQLSGLLRGSAFLDDTAARARFLEQAVRDWDRRTQDEVATFLGSRVLEAHRADTIDQLPAELRDAALTYLRRQRRFVDEERVQRFLVHQGLADLPTETRQAALRRLAQARLERQGRRKVANLDVATRQHVLAAVQRLGWLTDASRRTGILSRCLSDLEPEVRAGFGGFLARQVWTSRRGLSELEEDLRDRVLERLSQHDALVDGARLAALPHQTLGELDQAVAGELGRELADQLRADLATKRMEELAPDTRQAIHDELARRGYFVDPERVGWYERRTLAQLPIEVLRGLEMHLGRARLAEIGSVPFRELSQRAQEDVLAVLDTEGIAVERADRLRLTQVGTLADLTERQREAIAQGLGRRRLLGIRDQRPPALPEHDRAVVESYLRDSGYFSDEFKQQLFPFQRLEEFGPQVEDAITTTLVEELMAGLNRLPIGQLPAPVQAEAEARLRRAGYFLDRGLVEQVKHRPVEELSPALRHALEDVVGELLLTEPYAPGAMLPWPNTRIERSLDSIPLELLPNPIQEALWRYLDETGYFLDTRKRSEVLERRLVDLGNEALEEAGRDLAAHLETEIGDRRVSDLEDELRQGLREAVEGMGYFDSPAIEARLRGQPLATLPRGDLEALTKEFGQAMLNARSEDCLAQWPAADQVAILTHLQEADWFVDRTRLDRLKGQRLRDLAASLPTNVLETFRQRAAKQLQQASLNGLDRARRQLALDILYKGQLRLEENQMRSLRSQRVKDLDREVSDDLLRFLGSRTIAAWPSGRIEDLGEHHQAVLVAYLGRRIMSQIERRVLLYNISRLWIDYLTDIEDLRRGIGLEAFGQRDPLVEYKRKAYELFAELTDNIRRDSVRTLFRQAPEPLAVPGA